MGYTSERGAESRMSALLCSIKHPGGKNDRDDDEKNAETLRNGNVLHRHADAEQNADGVHQRAGQKNPARRPQRFFLHGVR